jgi:hypothetical protein
MAEPWKSPIGASPFDLKDSRGRRITGPTSTWPVLDNRAATSCRMWGKGYVSRSGRCLPLHGHTVSGPLGMRSFRCEDLLGPLNDLEKHNAPQRLYVAGAAGLLKLGTRVSVVGTRRPSDLGGRRAGRGGARERGSKSGPGAGCGAGGAQRRRDGRNSSPGAPPQLARPPSGSLDPGSLCSATRARSIFQLSRDFVFGPRLAKAWTTSTWRVEP